MYPLLSEKLISTEVINKLQIAIAISDPQAFKY